MEYTFTAAQLEAAMKNKEFYNNEEHLWAITQADGEGLVRRLSHTQKEWTEAGIAWYQGEVAEDLGFVYNNVNDKEYYNIVVDLETKSFFMVKNAGSDAGVYGFLKRSKHYYAKRYKVISNGTEKMPDITKVPKKYQRYVCFDRRVNT